MAKSDEQLARDITTKTTDLKPDSFNKKLNAWVTTHEKSIRASFKDDAGRFVRTVYNVCAFQPELLKVDFTSLVNCILRSLEINLYPGPVFEECAYVPRRVNGVYVACFEPMYKGLVKVASNAGMREVNTDIIYQADKFIYNTDKFFHQPAWDAEDRGDMRGAWCKIITPNGGVQIEVMNMREIYAHRARGAAAKKKVGPWFDDLFELGMIRKTPLKKALKYVPKSPKLAIALHLDNIAETREEGQPEEGPSAIPLELPEAFRDGETIEIEASKQGAQQSLPIDEDDIGVDI